jgi:hypothetical protein
LAEVGDRLAAGWGAVEDGGHWVTWD